MLTVWHTILIFGPGDLLNNETTQLKLLRTAKNRILPDQQPRPAVGDTNAEVKAMKRGVFTRRLAQMAAAHHSLDPLDCRLRSLNLTCCARVS